MADCGAIGRQQVFYQKGRELWSIVSVPRQMYTV